MSKIIDLAQQVEQFYDIRIDTLLPHKDGFSVSLLDGQIKIIANLFPGTEKYWIIIQSTSTINKRHTIKYEDIAEDTFDLYEILDTHKKLHNLVATNSRETFRRS